MEPRKKLTVHFSIPLEFPKISMSVRSWLPSRGNVLFTLLVASILFWTSTVKAFPWINTTAAAGTSTGTWPYQGRLADSAGNPITNVLPMTFRIYSASQGGAVLWEEEWDSVQVSDGLFNVMLGSLTPIQLSMVNSYSSLWLGITIGTDTEMTPRVQLGSVPFAAQALTVPDGSISASKVADGSITTTKIADGAISAAKVADGSILTAKIANGAISAAKIADGSITTAKIADGAITSAKIADKSITSDDLNLQNGTACLSAHAILDLPANYSIVDLTALKIDFALEKPSTILIWMDGLVGIEATTPGEVNVNLSLDGVFQSGEFTVQTADWFDLNGQRIIKAGVGPHTLTIRASSHYPVRLTFHSVGGYQVCINYLVISQN